MTIINDSPMYDYVIVGAGLFGAVFARIMTDHGKRCVVVERRPHIAGNCYTERREGILVHSYGPHIFHTNDQGVWEFVTQFIHFNRFIYKPKVMVRGTSFPFPINLQTLNQVFGVKTPGEAKALLQTLRHAIDNVSNFEDYLLSQIGDKLYTMFYRGYTSKQWGVPPRTLPVSLAKRVPIRFDNVEGYFEDKFQGIPEGGYSVLVANLLRGIDVRLNVDFLKGRQHFLFETKRVVYTGAIDEYFDFTLGRLGYRSLKFLHTVCSDTLQETCVLNHADENIPFTRSIEHKHFEELKCPHSIVTYEYPLPCSGDNEPFYPLGDMQNRRLYDEYVQLGAKENVIFAGRMGSYRYYNMDQVVAQAMTLAKNELKRFSIETV